MRLSDLVVVKETFFVPPEHFKLFTTFIPN